MLIHQTITETFHSEIAKQILAWLENSGSYHNQTIWIKVVDMTPDSVAKNSEVDQICNNK